MFLYAAKADTVCINVVCTNWYWLLLSLY